MGGWRREPRPTDLAKTKQEKERSNGPVGRHPSSTKPPQNAGGGKVGVVFHAALTEGEDGGGFRENEFSPLND